MMLYLDYLQLYHIKEYNFQLNYTLPEGIDGKLCHQECHVRHLAPVHEFDSLKNLHQEPTGKIKQFANYSDGVFSTN